MLPKKLRIKRSDFPYILKTSKRFNSQNLLLYIAKNPEDKGLLPTKFSFSVPKKVCRMAVDRNKLRRRGYSVISRILKNIKPGYVGFFVFKVGSKDLGFKEIEKEIETLLLRVGVVIYRDGLLI